MGESIIKKILPLVRAVLWLFLIALIIAFLIFFKNILIPIFYAIFMAFLIHELVELLGRIKFGGQPLPYWGRSILVLLLFISVVIGIVEIITANVDQIALKAPEYEETFGHLLLQIGDLTGAEDISKDLQEQIDSLQINSIISVLFSSFSSFLGNLFLVIIYGIFMLSERKPISAKIDAIFSSSNQRIEVQHVLDRIADAIRQYLSVKTFVSLLTGGVSYLILILFGIDFPVLWAFLIFLFNYVPYLGSLVATMLPTFLAIFQFESLLMGLLVFLSIQSVQTVVGSFIEPRFAGKTLNLSPTIVLFSLALWGVIWGIAGMAIAVPITSVIVIILAEFPTTRNAAILLSENGRLT